MQLAENIKRLWQPLVSRTTGRYPVTPISYERAMEIFDQLANRDDLALGYVQEGCAPRAILMCQTLIEHGLSPKRAWAIKEHEDDTKFSGQLPNGQKFEFYLHVAPALPVATPNSDVIDLMFDPALFDGPVPLQEWGNCLNASDYELQIKRFDQPPRNFARGNPASEASSEAILSKYRPLEVAHRIVFPSQYCRQYIFPSLGKWPLRQGHRWSSIEPDPTPFAPTAAKSFRSHAPYTATAH